MDSTNLRPRLLALFLFFLMGSYGCQQVSVAYSSINDALKVFSEGQTKDLLDNIKILESYSDFEYVIITTVDDVPNEGFLRGKKEDWGIGKKSGGNFVVLAVNPQLNMVGFFFDTAEGDVRQQEQMVFDMLNPLAVQVGKDRNYYKFMRQALCVMNDVLVLDIDPSELKICITEGANYYNQAVAYQKNNELELAFEYYTLAIQAQHLVEESSQSRLEVFEQLASQGSKEATRLESVLLHEEAIAFLDVINMAIEPPIEVVQSFLNDVANITKNFDRIEITSTLPLISSKHEVALKLTQEAIDTLKKVPELDDAILYRRGYLEYMEYIENGLRVTFVEWLRVLAKAIPGSDNKKITDEMQGLIAPFLKEMHKKGEAAAQNYGALAGKYGLY